MHFTVQDLVHNIVVTPKPEVSIPGFTRPGDEYYGKSAGVLFKDQHESLTAAELSACHKLTASSNPSSVNVLRAGLGAARR